MTNSINTPRPQFRWVSPQAFRHPAYQRDIDVRRVDRIADRFILSAFGVANLAERPDGGLYLMDAQTRSAAAIKAGISEVPALIHSGLLEQQEAELFLLLNESKLVSPISKFKAGVYAGYPIETAINRIVLDRGWRVERGSSPGTIGAVAALEAVYGGIGEVPAEAGAKLLETTLMIIEQAWGRDPQAADNRILRGVARVFARYNQRNRVVDGEMLVTKLRGTTPEALVGKSKGAAEYMGIKVAESMPMHIVNLYNERLRKNQIPIWEIRN